MNYIRMFHIKEEPKKMAPHAKTKNKKTYVKFDMLIQKPACVKGKK